jgi:glycerophosphoryl diester phosphodiesterase
VSELLLRDGRRPLLIGHRGLPALAPENTLRSFALALDHGADGFEVDVIALAGGELVAGHSLDLSELCHGAAHGRAAERTLAELLLLDPELATLEQVLELASAHLDGRLLLIDVKSTGVEQALIDALRRHGLESQALLCSLERSQLARLSELAPGIARSLSYPADRRRASERRALATAVPLALRAFRTLLPHRLGAWLDETRASAVTLHHAVISASLVRVCHERGVAVLAWTIDDAEVQKRLTRARIDAIITNDPRPFTSAPQ